MRNVFKLLRSDFVGLCGQKPVRETKWRTLTAFYLNVEGSPLLTGFNRNFAIFNVAKSSSSGNVCSTQYAGNTSAESKNNVIYCGALTPQIKGVKIFTCISSLGGIVIQPILVQHLLAGENVPITIAMGTMVGFFTFVTPFLIHLLTKKYVTEIQYSTNTDTYTATTLSFFLQRKKVDFKLEDVSIPEKLPLFATVTIKEKPVFIVSDSFLDISHYIKIMGYDKPMDLKLSVPIEKDTEPTLEKDRRSVGS